MKFQKKKKIKIMEHTTLAPTGCCVAAAASATASAAAITDGSLAQPNRNANDVQ